MLRKKRWCLEFETRSFDPDFIILFPQQLLTALSNVLGQERCMTIVLPTLNKLVAHSQFYVRKVIRGV